LNSNDGCADEKTLAWIEAIHPEDAQGTLREAYEYVSGPSGSVANILRAQSLHPDGLRDHYSLYRTLMYGRGALSRTQREAIALSVSATNGCHY